MLHIRFWFVDDTSIEYPVVDTAELGRMLNENHRLHPDDEYFTVAYEVIL